MLKLVPSVLRMEDWARVEPVDETIVIATALAKLEIAPVAPLIVA